MRTALLVATLILPLFGGAAGAASITADGLLAGFNTIALGDLDARSETEGTVFVGGDLRSNGYTVNPDGLANVTLGDVSGSLIVGGDVTGNPVNVNTGDVVIGGNAQAIVNLNGPNATRRTNVPGIPVETVRNVLTTLSADLARLGATDGAEVRMPNQNRRSIVSGAGGSGRLAGIAIINTTAAFFAGGGLNASDLFIDPGVTTILNVAGETVDFRINGNVNSSNILLNLYEAQNVNFSSGTLGFSILAPNATIRGSAGGVNGVVVGNDIEQGIEFRPYDDRFLFTGDLPTPEGPGTSPVPVPAAGWFLIAGFGSLALLRRRRAAA